MSRSILTTAFSLVMAMCVAQVDSSLTQDFSKRSAKERTRIALREQEESLRDEAFQALMASAEKLFQEKRYDDALARFKEARAARPYNVHPKVKIHDLEVYIRERDQAAIKTPPKVEDPIVKVPAKIEEQGVGPTADDRPPVKPLADHSAPIGTLDAIRPVERKVPDPPIKEVQSLSASMVKMDDPGQRSINSEPMPVQVRSRSTASSGSERPGPELSQGERIFKEAGAIVIERIVEEEGRLVVYRKVTRPWVDPIHFREGIAITVHAWIDVFGDR